MVNIFRDIFGESILEGKTNTKIHKIVLFIKL